MQDLHKFFDLKNLCLQTLVLTLILRSAGVQCFIRVSYGGKPKSFREGGLGKMTFSRLPGPI